MWLHLCSCSWHFLNSPAGGSLGEEQFSFSPTPTPPPPAYQQNRKNVDSAMCLLFSGLRMGFPRLFLQNGYFGIQSIIRKEPICICVCDYAVYQSSKKFFFFICRNSTGFISLWPDICDMALGRPAHGLQTFLDVGPLCHFQQSTGKLTIWLLMAHMYPSEHRAWSFNVKESSVNS